MTDIKMSIAAPVALTPSHELVDFRSGEDVLDQWLRQRAIKNIKLAATRTYVSCIEGTQKVVGYYALSMGQILRTDVPKSAQRNMPGSIPSVLLGRLAVDSDFQGQGLGQSLLFDAIKRAQQASESVAARLVIVHAISDDAEQFYIRNGFTRLPVATPTLALDLVKLRMGE